MLVVGRVYEKRRGATAAVLAACSVSVFNRPVAIAYLIVALAHRKRKCLTVSLACPHIHRSDSDAPI